jgi:integrase
MKGTKTGQMRSLPLWDDVVDLLKEQHRQQEICTGTAIRPVFILGDDSGLAPINPDYLTERFQTIAEKLGLDGVHLHSMRHAFASFLIESGVDVVTVSKLVGHSTITTTLNIYAHTNETAKRAAIVGLPKLALPA